MDNSYASTGEYVTKEMGLRVYEMSRTSILQG